MALLHHATLTPGKLELLASWVPGQPWLDERSVSGLSVAGAYRFDDPEGEVGLEVHLLATGTGDILQVPTTYRAAPVPDLPLIGTAEHSVLGTRWVYDGCSDPVFTGALTTAILTGATQADIEFQTDEGRVLHPPSTFVRGSGVPGTAVPASGLQLTVQRVLDPELAVPDGVEALTGTWPGQVDAVLLATLRER